jgi:D-alanine-D-alanine ligase
MENETKPPLPSVGITYNLKKGVISEADDIEAEYDSFDTIAAIRDVFLSEGYKVELFEADADIVERLKEAKPDIVFNIAEGTNGRGREAHIPAILSYLGIPYTGSDETTLAMALDKEITKRYLSTFHIQTPDYRLAKSPSIEEGPGLTFPLIVKPNHEGSGKGIGQTAVVDNAEELKAVLDKNFKLYGQPMLIEQFISGREFTVGVLGNGENARAFEPMEIHYLKEGRENRVYSFHVKTHYKDYVEYICPPLLDDETNNRMKETALKIHRVLSCRDFSRIDFRLSDQGDIYFIEINPLPGLAPSYSDYPMIAEFCGMSYKELILSVFNCALERYGMKPWNPNRGE